MENQKRLLSTILAVIVVMLCLFIGGYFAYQQFSKPQVEVETKDWKTYSNDQYRIEFRYPKEWGDPKVNLLSTKVSFDFPLNQDSYTINFTIGSQYDQNKQRMLTFNEIVESMTTSYSDKGHLIDQATITIDGKMGVKLDRVQPPTGELIEVYLPIDLKGNIFIASSYTNTPNENFNNFNKFLSTIKFTK